ncbi:glycosyltransferase [Halarchaeum sp. CBA1220]|uniref:glycosyltransferase n=1 Tax=Halarchaeum sp. CBA1220 TaxID=1853682 RepID=UPI00131422DF|nr:glycosyltransferase [Halarchaeum sp. CBA1220]QLC34409.1 glycosyltransferase [Halarchaeum sp. CBA1220]
MNESPRVSVVVPTYNGEAYVRDAVDSVLAQSFADVEVLVVDDGSTDGTVAAVESYDDERVTLHENEENLGIAGNMNRGASLAEGDVLAFLDQDDYWRTEKLERHLERHDADDAAVVYSDVEVVDGDGTTLEYADPPAPASAGLPLVRQLYVHLNFLRSFSCVTVEREAWRDAGGLDESFDVSADYDLYVRLAADHRFALADAPLAVKRTHEGNASGDRVALYDDIQRVLERTRERHPAVTDLSREQRATHGFEQAFCAYRADRPREGLTHCVRSLRSDPRPITGFLFAVLALDLLTGPVRAGTAGYRLYRRWKAL